MTQVITLQYSTVQAEGPLMTRVYSMLPSEDDMLQWTGEVVAEDDHRITITVTDTVPPAIIVAIQALQITAVTGVLAVDNARVAKNDRVVLTWIPADPVNNTITVMIVEDQVTFTDEYAFKCNDIGEYIIVPVDAEANTISVEVVERKNLTWIPD